MKEGYVLLVEKEEMWAKMLIQVLKDNSIPCAAVPVFGAGLSIKAGMQERLKVNVPSGNLPHARKLVEELFSSESIQEE